MKTTFVLLICLAFLSAVYAQTAKRSTQDFMIYQDDNETPLLALQVPVKSQISKEFNFATYVISKSSLVVFYELDDEPESVETTKNISSGSLLKYAHHLSDKEIAGSDATVLHKKIAAKPVDINGLKTVLIEYDYVKKASGKGDEKGKSFLYLIPIKGTSASSEKEHPIIVRLTFDFDLPSGADPDYTLQKEIVNTLKPANRK